MINIGRMNKLKIYRKDKKGIFLKEQMGNDRREVFIPIKELGEDIGPKDIMEVFVYTDARGNLKGTLNKPYGMVGELAYLRVVDITSIGVFLDWGLDKDLFLPQGEQKGRVIKNQHYLVKIYLDKSQRLCASMNVEDMLRTHPSYKEGDMVDGIVYDYNSRMGAFIAVDKQYFGLVHLSEIFKSLRVGDKGIFRIIKVREDGRLDLSTRQLAYRQMEEDAEHILQLLEQRGGFLPLNDKSDPEKIKKYTAMSKNAFKRALGRLLKEKKAIQEESGIRLMDKVND